MNPDGEQSLPLDEKPSSSFVTGVTVPLPEKTFTAVVTVTYEVEVQAYTTLYVPEKAVALLRDTLPTDIHVHQIREKT